MPHGDFVWCDLSARRLDIACAFYARLLGWRIGADTMTDGSEYRIAETARPVAGLYTMPRKFDDMGMPCFWMSYIAVDNAAAAVETARDLGGKVEVGPIDGIYGSTVALIRDPLGAGFTVIDGPGLTPRPAQPQPGDMAWNALYVSDAAAVIPFYRALFGWTIAPATDGGGRHHVHRDGARISEIHELPDAVRGKEQYWGIHFAVDDLAAANSLIRAEGGQLVYEDTETLLARDPDGAAFFLSEPSSFAG